MTRSDNRSPDHLRAVTMQPDFVMHPEGSVLIKMGNTHVLCNATLENKVPYWMKAQRKSGGWVTAEYALLPRSTSTRVSRETRGPRGRTQEIQRLIGRSLRAAINLDLLDGYTCTIDCDVIQADGGTRTAAITGGYVALVLALRTLIDDEKIPAEVLTSPVAAISVGMVGGEPMLDLCYEEDFSADVDFNVVMTAEGEFIEVQGTAEGVAFSRAQLDQLLDLAEKGIQELLVIQQEILKAEA